MTRGQHAFDLSALRVEMSVSSNKIAKLPDRGWSIQPSFPVMPALAASRRNTLGRGHILGS
jgi:hypothetical protein